MSKHGYRMVGYGGLINDLYGHGQYPEYHKVEVSVPPIVVPAQQQQMIAPQPLPERVKAAVLADVEEHTDLILKVINTTTELNKAFLEGLSAGVLTGSCNIHVVDDIPEEQLLPSFEISIKCAIPKR